MPQIPGTFPGSTVLDGPPPSPALDDTANPGTPGQGPNGPLGSMTRSVPASQIPPEILTGILQAGQSVDTFFDSVAQSVPDVAMFAQAAKAANQRLLAEVARAGGGPIAPNAPGNNFPGGGIDRGGMTTPAGGVG